MYLNNIRNKIQNNLNEEKIKKKGKNSIKEKKGNDQDSKRNRLIK